MYMHVLNTQHECTESSSLSLTQFGRIYSGRRVRHSVSEQNLGSVSPEVQGERTKTSPCFVGRQKLYETNNLVTVALPEILLQRNMKSDTKTTQFEVPWGIVFLSRALQWLNLLRNVCRKMKAKKNASQLPSKHRYKEKFI